MREIASKTEWKFQPVSFKGIDNQYAAVNRVIKRYSAFIATKMARVFAETAARFTPPNMGKANIEEKYYYRPVQELTKLAKGEYPPYHATRADFAALRQGFKFRVLNTKLGHRKNEVYAYTKGINEAKRVSRIQNRGLSRYTWGDALNNHAEEIFQMQAQNGGLILETNLPPIFHRLAKKSPNITKYHFGYSSAKIQKGKEATYHVQVVNKLADSERYCRIAIERGTMAVNRWSNKFFNACKNRLQRDVTKLIEDTKLYFVKFK